MNIGGGGCCNNGVSDRVARSLHFLEPNHHYCRQLNKEDKRQIQKKTKSILKVWLQKCSNLATLVSEYQSIDAVCYSSYFRAHGTSYNRASWETRAYLLGNVFFGKKFLRRKMTDFRKFVR